MNMRKIIALLSAVLMLCSAIPVGVMSVTAAPGDVAMDWNFDDGVAHFERGAAENGYLVFDATTADWQCAFAYVNGIKANTMYKVTFKAMANKDADLNFKINNNWAGDTVKETVAVTTEWQDYELTINSGELNSAVVMFASDYAAGNAPIYYIDDLKIVEVVDPALIGKVINGDFETGDNTGWSTHQSTTIDATAAKDGSYGAHLKGNGSWGGMLNQTIVANAGKSYEITMSFKVVSNGVNIQIMDAAGSQKLASGWYDTNSAGDWTTVTYLVTAVDAGLMINFCGGGNGIAEELYVDSISAVELKEPSFDGYITNGDFETGKTDSWDPVWWAGNIAIVEGGYNSDYALQANHGMYQLFRQKVSVKPNTNYVVWVYNKNASNMTLLVKDGNDGGNLKQAGLTGTGDEWTKTSLEFNSGDWSEVYIGVMGNVAGATAIVDDFFMFEKPEASNDGYIVNGTFETGDIQPWNNLWGSCPKAEVVKGGMDSNWALEVVSGQWRHVRQTNIAVEANTDYKITAWAKNAKNMSLLVKDGNDSADLVNAGVNAGEEWTEFTAEFNSGDYTTIIFSLMGNAEEAYGTFDNIVMEKIEVACEHNYELTNGQFAGCEVDGWAEYTCSICGDSYTETIPAYHNGNMEYSPAKDAIDCATPGNIENWYCPGCNEYYADAYAENIINPWYITITVDCVRPEGVADCATWTCETCGNENYGAGEHDTGVAACQDGHCSKCDQDIAGYGCENYDTPICEDGVCFYCGGFVAGLGHENGAWAPCLNGECSYGCGLTYPATAEHVDEDANDYCDVCWNHLAHIDEDANGECDICWSQMPAVEIIYGDANGDGIVNLLDEVLLAQYNAEWDVTLDEAAADANGDGIVNLLDEVLLAQYNAEWDVTLGG